MTDFALVGTYLALWLAYLLPGAAVALWTDWTPADDPDSVALIVWPVLAFRRTARMTKPADKTDEE